MIAKNFRNFVPQIFASEESREQRVLEKIEARKQQRLYATHLGKQLTGQMDRLEQESRACDVVDTLIDGECELTTDQLVGWLRDREATPATLSVLARRAAEAAALRSVASDLKMKYRELRLAPHQKSLANFTKENWEVIRHFPPFVKSKAPPFQAAANNPNVYLDGTSAKAVREALGIFLNPPKTP